MIKHLQSDSTGGRLLFCWLTASFFCLPDVRWWRTCGWSRSGWTRVCLCSTKFPTWPRSCRMKSVSHWRMKWNRKLNPARFVFLRLLFLPKGSRKMKNKYGRFKCLTTTQLFRHTLSFLQLLVKILTKVPLFGFLRPISVFTLSYLSQFQDLKMVFCFLCLVWKETWCEVEA